MAFPQITKKGLVVLRRWFFCCWLLLPLWGSVFVPCFVVHCYVSFLVLQSSWWGRESWLLYFVFLVSCSSSSRCRGLVCSVCLWYFLIILIFFIRIHSFKIQQNSGIGDITEFLGHRLYKSCLILTSTVWSVVVGHVVIAKQFTA